MSDNIKKTIQINPELFKLPGGQKTRKNRSKPELDFTPIVSTSNIKNKLLSRIKEHKKKQFDSNKSNDKVNDSNKALRTLENNKGNRTLLSARI